MTYKNELADYLKKRLAIGSCSVELITGGNKELFAYIQLMWTVQFYIDKCEELDDRICMLNDFSDEGT